MEALEIKDIDMMIRSLEKELQGVEVTEIMVTTPDQDSKIPNEIITITEEEIVATLPKPPQSVQPLKESVQKEEPSNIPEVQAIDDAPVESKEEVLAPKPIAVETPVETVPPVTQVDPHQKTFDELLAKIYDRNFDLGECFKRNIEFESFIEGKLTWGSIAEGIDKKQLITHWGVINMFVKELFGFETKIVNIAKKKVIDTSTSSVSEVNKVAEPAVAPHSDADAGSMIEDIEMKSSCIAPEAGETEAAKEKDPSTLLNEPMIKEAIALFDPKKVRIKRNS